MIRGQTVYEPVGSDGYELCHPTNDDGFRSVSELVNGLPRSAGWKPIPVAIIREDRGLALEESDSPWLGSNALIFRARAIERLGDGLSRNGELLPLACDSAVVSLFNPTHVVDALNEEASDVLRFQDGRLMGIQRHVFDPAKIAGLELFKIGNLEVSPTYVTQAFVDRWRLARLKGLEFQELWPNPKMTGFL